MVGDIGEKGVSREQKSGSGEKMVEEKRKAR